MRQKVSCIGMEYIVVIAVLVFLALLAGLTVEVISFWALGLIVLMLISFAAFFIYCTLVFAFSKSVVGRFVEIGEGKHHFDCAFYEINGSEYPNMFPCEVVMRSKIYCRDKDVRLRLCSNRFVIDANALLTIIFGDILCIPLAGAAVWAVFMI